MFTVSSEAELPARAEEVHHAKEEGIIFDLLTNPVEILTDDKDWVTGIRCIRMELGEPDASGRRRPVEIPGSEFEIEVDDSYHVSWYFPEPADFFHHLSVWMSTEENVS